MSTISEGLDHRLGLVVVDEPVEALVGNVHAGGVGVDRAEGKVLRRDAAVGEGVVQRGLADVGHTHETDLRRGCRGSREGGRGGVSAGQGRRRAGGGGVRTRVSRIGGIESRASSLLRGSVPPAGETRRGGEGDASSGEVAIGRNESPNAASVCERPRARELRFKLRTFRLELKRPRAQGPSFSPRPSAAWSLLIVCAGVGKRTRQSFRAVLIWEHRNRRVHVGSAQSSAARRRRERTIASSERKRVSVA